MKTIKIRYPTAKRLSKDISLIRKGKIFIPAEKPAPTDSRLRVEITVPWLEHIFTAQGIVIQAVQQGEELLDGEPPGMLIAFVMGSEITLAQLIGSYEDFTKGLILPIVEKFPAAALTPRTPQAPAPEKAPDNLPEFDQKTVPETPVTDNVGTAFSLQQLNAMFDREFASARAADEAVEETAPPPVTRRPVRTKLGLEEIQLARPAADFVMDLTKAMIRSGYYDPNHPSSKLAKSGLFQKFRAAFVDENELMLTREVFGDKPDISITGILDEPFSIRKVEGETTSELFVPKLCEYFENKGLVGLAIKKDITQKHFELFVDIMRDPEIDHGSTAGSGELLTRALVENGISEVSAIFRDDMLGFDEDVPWRVQMAIHRLVKDLKILPLFKEIAEEEITAMKVQIIRDILRPLREPHLLRDMIINCYTIAQSVKNLDPEDLERTIIASFPVRLLLPASVLVVEEVKKLQEQLVENRDKPDVVKAVNRKLSSTKRILSRVARRMVREKAKGINSFLEDMYFSGIIAFRELPPEVQYRVNTVKMAEDIRINAAGYLGRLQSTDAAKELTLLLKCFQRTTTHLVEQGSWQVLHDIAEGVARKAGQDSELFAQTGLPVKPIPYIFHDSMSELVSSFTYADEDGRNAIARLASLLGSAGTELLSRILQQNKDMAIRKLAVSALISQGETARCWAQKILSLREQEWFMRRNALLVLGHVGDTEQDMAVIRKFLHHTNAKLREEALVSAIKLKARDVEPLVISAINDKDENVQKLAIASLKEIAPVSEASLHKLLKMISEQPAEEAGNSAGRDRRTARLIRALGAMANQESADILEGTILEVTRQITDQKKGFFDFFNINEENEQSVVLVAAIETLGRMGGARSMAYLQELADTGSPQAETAQQAREKIEKRMTADQ